MLDTRGRQRLVEWAGRDAGARTQTAIADALSVSQPSVADWMSGKSRPRPAQRDAIERLTDGFVVAVDWKTDEERRLLRLVRPMRATGTNG